MFPALDLPSVDSATMRQVDDLAEGEFHIHLLQMMENAGRALARLARMRYFEGNALRHRVLVLAGPGGNGGGGMAAARRLHAWGTAVAVILATDPGSLSQAPRQQLRALQAAGIDVQSATVDLPETELIIDALLGYSARGAPRPPISGLVRAALRSRTPVLSLDIPTGLDPDSGLSRSPCLHAHATLTLALPKRGLLTLTARDYVGELWLADLGIPPELYERLGLQVPPALFARDDLVRLEI